MKPTLVLSPRYTPDSAAVRRAALAAGWHVQRLPGWRWHDAPPPDHPVAIYGEPLFARAVAAQGGRVMLEPTLDWLAHLPSALLGRAVGAGTFAERDQLTYPRFVKPADDKAFPAAVYPSAAAIPHAAQVPGGTEILHSDPVVFVEEYRCFVADGAVTAASLYAVHGEVTTAPGDPAAVAQAVAVAEAAWAACPSPPGVVIDVGRTADARLVVIEANPAFGAGIYQADPAGVLTVLAQICRPLAEVADSPFVRPIEVE